MTEQVVKRGRGRPRKSEVIPGLIAQEKRGRVRPRKDATVVLTSPVKRGRGRPPKVVAPVEAPKRGRGRPPKPKVTYVMSVSAKAPTRDMEKELTDIISASVRPIVQYMMKREFRIY